jgi:hypothetical protein
MTNKKLKMAAMSVALTACVAASPLAANADAPEAAPEKTEPVAEETKKEENTAEPQVNQKAKNAQETLKDAEVKYDKEHPTTNPDGSQKLDGVIVTTPEGSGETDPDPNPDSGETGSGETGSGETGSGETGSGETDPDPNPNPNPDSGETNPNPNPDSGETNPNPNPDSGETNPNPNPDSGETDPNPNPGSGETGSGETGGTTDPEQKKPEEVEIGTAEKTEKSETNVETKPNPGAEPIKDNTPPTVEKNPDGSTTITQTTVTPGKETSTTTGTGEAKGDLHEKKEEVKEIALDKELGENPNISWDIKPGAEAVEGKGYKVEDVTTTPDGNQQTLKLRKEEETTAEMTAEDIAKLVDAEKPTVNPDGTYTLTRTETILDAEGNPQTRTTYITIQDNKVTTKTTTELTITREKVERDGEESFRDEVKYPEIQIKNGDTVVDTIQPEDLEKMLNAGTPADDGIHYTAPDGKEYVITESRESTGTPLGNKEIVERLNRDGNTAYKLGEDGEIYYTTPHNETVKLNVTQRELLRRNLSIKVKVTETTKDTKTETPGKETAENEAKMNAANDAVKNALMQMGLNETEALEALNVGTLNTADHTFTATYKGKNYTLNYTAPTTSEDPSKVTDLPNEPGKTTDTKEHTVTGTAYVTGSTITYQAGAEYKTTGVDTLGMGADFKTAPKDADPDSIQKDTAGRITSYTDAEGKTHSFEYDDNVDLEHLSPEERAELDKAATKNGWTTKDLTASLTRVSWKVESPRTEIPQTTPIENGETVNLVNDNNWSQTDHGDTVDFTHDNTTYTGMTLENESGNVKTYKKTEANGTVTIITVTTRQLGEEEIKAKFGNNFISLNLDDKTVTYTGEDGKTYKANYVAQEEKLTVDIQTPDAVAATGSTEEEAQKAFLEKLEEARIEAEKNKETLVIEYNENGVIKTLKVDRKMKWEEVSMVVGNVVNYNAMTDAELTTYLKELEATAKKDGKYYTGSTRWKTPYYWDDDTGKMQRVPPEEEIDQRWDGDYVIIDGEEHRVHYNRNNISHLDLATDSHLTLSEKNENGTAKTDDCVLLNNPTLKWSEKAETLVNGGGTQANFVDRITYDHENDDDENTGHYEYPRASWDKDHGWAIKSKKNNAPTKSVFYKVEGKVAYGKLGNAYEATPTGGLFGNEYTQKDYDAARRSAENDLEKYRKANPGLDLSKAQVVEIYKDQYKYGERYYQIYLYQSDLTAYGYMSDDNNTCGNALFNPNDWTDYIGGYDLTLGNLTQTDEKHVVAMGKNTIALSATIKRRKLVENLTNRELRYTPKSVTETIIHESEVIGQDTDLSGSYQANYTKTADYRDEQQGGIAGHGTGSYKSFTNLIRNIFNGDGKGTVEGGFVKYEYHTEKNSDGTPVQFEADKMVVTTKQDAEVHYTFTSQESRDVWIKGYTQTVVPPVNPGPDSPELPPVEDAKPAPAPEAPVLPVVQDARPDPAPAPAPAPAPETPVLPAVQDAKLIQTGTSGWLADLMLGAGMVLSAAGYWMERKRKAMFYKSQH